jgi:predicted RecB family nuclease
MQLLDGEIVFTATDLVGFSRCDHLTTLDANWVSAKSAPFAPPIRSPFAELLSRRGTQKEAEFVAGIGSVETIELRDRTTLGYEAAAEATTDAMRRGTPKIYQAVFFDGTSVGISDLLVRVERPSRLGEWSYEALDVKLARDVRPHFVLQLCSYSDHLGRIQGVEPEHMHLSLGTGESAIYRWADFSAYYRHLRSRFVTALRDGKSSEPYPNEFCELCHWNLNCWRQWQNEDHLSIVSGIRKQHVHRLVAAGISTLMELGETLPTTDSVPQLRRDTLQRLHDQARLQLKQRQSGERVREFLPLEKGRGLYRLPVPSPGDLYFDVEADPLAGDEGITYLFGLASHDEGSGRLAYTPRWAHDAEREKSEFEAVIDSIVVARTIDPGLHVYHYGAADVSTLKRLMGRYATREDELDDLLRANVFVDLFSVVRQTMRISQPSYSLKKLEEFFFTRTERAVADAGGAILAYEQWLETREAKLLREIEQYNREDCESVAALAGWSFRKGKPKLNSGSRFHGTYPRYCRSQAKTPRTPGAKRMT